MNYYLITTLDRGVVLFQGHVEIEGSTAWLVPPGCGRLWWLPTESIRQLTLDEAIEHVRSKKGTA